MNRELADGMLVTRLSLAVRAVSIVLICPLTLHIYVSPATDPEVMRSGAFQNMKDGDP
jgi:hypothetical protein